MITHCTACGTYFRVVADQLKIADGWVRCGQCGEVFDAHAHLEQPSTDRPAAPAATAPGALSQPAPLPTAASVDDPKSHALDLLLDDLGTIPHAASTGSPVAAEPAEPAAAPPRTTEAAQAAPSAQAAAPATPLAAPAAPQLAPGADADADADAGQAPAKTAAAEPAWYAEFKQSLPADHALDAAEGSPADPAGDLMVAPALDRVGFVRQARNREFWQSGLVRALLTAVASVLVLLLVMQVLVHQRDRLAARQPQLRPLLEWLCVPIGCAVRPVRQVDAVAIEGSSFNRVGPTVYRLVFSVRNQADTPIAMPWFEITLSDPNEQPLVRRVLSPADLGLREPAVLGARADWSASLDLDLALDPATARVAGYRLLAFYP